MPAANRHIGSTTPRIGCGVVYIHLFLVGGCFQAIVLTANCIDFVVQGDTRHMIARVGQWRIKILPCWNGLIQVEHVMIGLISIIECVRCAGCATEEINFPIENRRPCATPTCG